MKVRHPDQRYIDALVNNHPLILDELYQKYSQKIKWLILQKVEAKRMLPIFFSKHYCRFYRKAKSAHLILTCPLEAFFVVCRNKWMNELNRKNTLRVIISETSERN